MKKPRVGPIALETVLVTTIGTSPSVLTSTIWALAHHENMLPHRIKVLTTRLGYERLVQQVFSPSPDFGGHTVWESLCRNLEATGYDLTGRLEFAPTAAYLRVFSATSPGERSPHDLDDITSQAENEQVADAMLETLRSVMNDDTRIVASIAGGRKTVSALFYACVSLIGRSEDRIIHVVVNEPFDRADLKPSFFFPTQKCARLVGGDGRTVKARDAKVSVIDVPFVPLANLFPRELGRTPGRFSALVSEYREAGQRQSLGPVRLAVHRSKLEIVVNSISVALAPREQLLAVFLAEQVCNGNSAFAKLEQALGPMKECFFRLVAEAPRKNWSDWRSELSRNWGKAWGSIDTIEKRGDISTDIRRALSSLGKKLRAAGPPVAILAAALPQRGHFALNLAKEQVQLLE